MASYMISYQLNKQGQDYNGLYDKLKECYPVWCHATTSTWIVVTEDDCETIRNNLSPHIDANDMIIVCKLAGVGAWRGFNQKTTDWLMKHL